MKFHNIEGRNIENGHGIRVLLWVSGCFHHCPGCHNPVTHDPNDGVEFDSDAMNEIIEALKPDYISGLTLTGGDGLCFYKQECLDVIREVRRHFGNSKTIWIYTGFTLERLLKDIFFDTSTVIPEMREVLKEILLETDVLCDGKFEQDKASVEYHWVGSTNQRVIDMRKTISEGKLVFAEKEQEKFCTTDNTEVNELISRFSNVLNTKKEV